VEPVKKRSTLRVLALKERKQILDETGLLTAPLLQRPTTGLFFVSHYPFILANLGPFNLAGNI
jgi:hypothetical protein